LDCAPFLKSADDEVLKLELHPTIPYVIGITTFGGNAIVINALTRTVLWQQSRPRDKWYFEALHFCGEEYLLVLMEQKFSEEEVDKLGKEYGQYSPPVLQIWAIPHQTITSPWTHLGDAKLDDNWRLNLGFTPMISQRILHDGSWLLVVHIWDPPSGNVFWTAMKLDPDGTMSPELYRIREGLQFPVFSQKGDKIFAWIRDERLRYLVIDACTGNVVVDLDIKDAHDPTALPQTCTEKRGMERTALINMLDGTLAVFRPLASEVKKNPYLRLRSRFATDSSSEAFVIGQPGRVVTSVANFDDDQADYETVICMYKY
jgi:hypothetical protein